MCKPRREALEETNPAAPWSWTSGVQICEKTNACYVSPLVCGTYTVMAAGAKTRGEPRLHYSVPALLPATGVTMWLPAKAGGQMNSQGSVVLELVASAH